MIGGNVSIVLRRISSYSLRDIEVDPGLSGFVSIVLRRISSYSHSQTLGTFSSPRMFQSSSDVSLRTHDGWQRNDGRDDFRFNRPQTYLFVLTKCPSEAYTTSADVSIVLRRISSYSRASPPSWRCWGCFVSIVLRRISSYSPLRTHPKHGQASMFQSSSDVSLRTHVAYRIGPNISVEGFNRPQTYLFVLTLRFFPRHCASEFVSIVLRRISSYSHQRFLWESMDLIVSIVLRRISSYSHLSHTTIPKK